MHQTSRTISRFISGALCLFGVSLTAPIVLPTHAEEASPMLLADHPLAGSLWETSTGSRLDSVEPLFGVIAGADYVLLGEKHDNPRHHALQATMLSMAAATKRPGHVVFEMLEPKQQAILDALNKAGTVPADELDTLGEDLAWEARGWPDWGMYQEIFSIAVGSGMQLHAGNPDRELVMSMGRGGSLSEEQLEDLRWDVDYDETARDSLLDELVDAHCGMMDRDAMTPLLTLQRLKDAYMGRALRQAKGEGEIAVLIAGNGHTRKDRGVPMFLDEDAKIVAIAPIEVVRGVTDPTRYSAFDPALYDYVWFTPRVDEIDPCERFRTQLEQMKSNRSEHGKQ